MFRPLSARLADVRVRERVCVSTCLSFTICIECDVNVADEIICMQIVFDARVCVCEWWVLTDWTCLFALHYDSDGYTCNNNGIEWVTFAWHCQPRNGRWLLWRCVRLGLARTVVPRRMKLYSEIEIDVTTRILSSQRQVEHTMNVFE